MNLIRDKTMVGMVVKGMGETFLAQEQTERTENGKILLPFSSCSINLVVGSNRFKENGF